MWQNGICQLAGYPFYDGYQIKSNQIKLFYSAPKSWPESWPT